MNQSPPIGELEMGVLVAIFLLCIALPWLGSRTIARGYFDVREKRADGRTAYRGTAITPYPHDRSTVRQRRPRRSEEKAA